MFARWCSKLGNWGADHVNSFEKNFDRRALNERRSVLTIRRRVQLPDPCGVMAGHKSNCHQVSKVLRSHTDSSRNKARYADICCSTDQQLLSSVTGDDNIRPTNLAAFAIIDADLLLPITWQSKPFLDL